MRKKPFSSSGYLGIIYGYMQAGSEHAHSDTHVCEAFAS
jgi:hypothetical protein